MFKKDSNEEQADKILDEVNRRGWMPVLLPILAAMAITASYCWVYGATKAMPGFEIFTLWLMLQLFTGLLGGFMSATINAGERTNKVPYQYLMIVAAIFVVVMEDLLMGHLYL